MNDTTVRNQTATAQLLANDDVVRLTAAARALHALAVAQQVSGTVPAAGTTAGRLEASVVVPVSGVA